MENCEIVYVKFQTKYNHFVILCTHKSDNEIWVNYFCKFMKLHKFWGYLIIFRPLRVYYQKYVQPTQAVCIKKCSVNI